MNKILEQLELAKKLALEDCQCLGGRPRSDPPMCISCANHKLFREVEERFEKTLDVKTLQEERDQFRSMAIKFMLRVRNLEMKHGEPFTTSTCDNEILGVKID